MWNPEDYQNALRFAGEAHAEQKLPSSPANYTVHLAQVAMEILHAWAQAPGDWDVNLAMQCALLHDVLEDTDTPQSTLEARFGQAVSQGVRALSKDKSLAKAEQMQDSLARIRATGQAEIAMVKLADRITNLQKPPSHWDHTKIAKYQAEARIILAELGFANTFLAQRLANKIEAYGQYL
ncbi:bifunctional (p)ppGpp synthetase/guanosine-3',5'-bis(diphosphate) 3'-pyrophosphohydrolase [bacterium (Candidatus Blackallbacteria) CG17_big_fil_post_rev_8_21_14_2_50_48_46]|uniref:Bifunctional (P)ppGpp synthetase/guanosine-3',5'-bis(Diphosphate) 3'-pyrophosphohydrolase n=1 Tax=bacterium (Candidatus Blackallbacteria) CG17_big_fil_post_rev_8_21_14_2_50_48_46 TaxID=2014261 RepID=A0A2M7G0X9_9BACT|nr:MAG: guanosine polyphosphate pyrophosphohydrolase [bacterium (Candidatus Blackallbacteria) CG18_big_fil_WC_8_21_14_2_50_49_26]PIW15332.1 MAG: bifunctional (p)ppGpp synthetase/guanosine-3',5'-bis(diphosphate) 3'-pyrophosphohydrolase [bacterium (Candidatus Blackallbacteria) CG17_big_fil_post_rev_8_21_14_2_50_48_46]PIW49807.1 MAG: bifunctional (p)ppGpp synthetase/guanosine-3',5'-bis(diphosphate) 3'-pyrophosphohydrolase [bacterium (Candidatus Blackallbacteria) CG13_big_fil_rev_8_21_14_2_50_49_14]